MAKINQQLTPRETNRNKSSRGGEPKVQGTHPARRIASKMNTISRWSPVKPINQTKPINQNEIQASKKSARKEEEAKSARPFPKIMSPSTVKTPVVMQKAVDIKGGRKGEKKKKRRCELKKKMKKKRLGKKKDEKEIAKENKKI